MTQVSLTVLTNFSFFRMINSTNELFSSYKFAINHFAINNNAVLIIFYKIKKE